MNTPSRKRHIQKTPRVFRSVHRVLRTVIAPVFTSRFDLVGENTDFLRRLKPPYLILACHRSHLDPFFISYRVPHPIQFVVADAQFRSRIVSFALSLIGAIPKTKVMSDFDAVRSIMRVKDQGGVIGIFPEGQNSWDGTPLPVYYSTAKLARLLKIPVVIAVVKGAFFAAPRWGRGWRRGEIHIEFHKVFDGPDLRSIPIEEIHRVISEKLSHDEYEYQAKVNRPYVGRRRAERIERALFYCPECKRFDALVSHRNSLSCTACGMQVEYGYRGRFRPATPGFATVKEWNVRQVEALARALDSYQAGPRTKPFMAEGHALVETGFKSRPLERFHYGRLHLFADRLVVEPIVKAREISFFLSDLDGLNVQQNERMEFYSGGLLYRFSFTDHRLSMYKWFLAMRYLAGKPLFAAERGLSVSPRS